MTQYARVLVNTLSVKMKYIFENIFVFAKTNSLSYRTYNTFLFLKMIAIQPYYIIAIIVIAVILYALLFADGNDETDIPEDMLYRGHEPEAQPVNVNNTSFDNHHIDLTVNVLVKNDIPVAHHHGNHLFTQTTRRRGNRTITNTKIVEFHNGKKTGAATTTSDTPN